MNPWIASPVAAFVTAVVLNFAFWDRPVTWLSAASVVVASTVVGHIWFRVAIRIREIEKEKARDEH